ncbi:MAG: cell wall-binding repeat-containing protein [Actinomycetota bacterium]|nr:cell wall-binding repeat-containing protein [Actinomycetota bacterium]
MLQVTVDRRHLVVFTAVVALVVSVAWVGVTSRASAASATPVVYVATGENFPDALGAGPAAAIVKGPILLVSKNAIPVATKAELVRLAPGKIIIVGGTAVVSASVANGLKAYAGSVVRIAGANRYETAAKLSAATFPATIDADTLDGKDSSAFLTKAGKAADSDKLDGKDSSAFLTKASYDKDKDGVVDSAEVKIRYSDQDFSLDMGATIPGQVRCVTSLVAFDGATTVVASGGLSLEPLGPNTDYIFGYVKYTKDGGATWHKLNGDGVEDAPEGSGRDAAVPIDAVETLGAGSFMFAIHPMGVNFQGGDDYSGYCELTITAYTGQGATTDVVVDSAGLTAKEEREDS